MDRSQPKRFAVDEWGCKRLILTFICTLATFIIVGLTAPSYLEVASSQNIQFCPQDSIRCGEDCTSKFQLELTALKETHQYAEVSFAFYKGQEYLATARTDEANRPVKVTLFSDFGERWKTTTSSSEHIRDMTCDAKSQKSKLVDTSKGNLDELCSPTQLVSLQLVQQDVYPIMIEFEGNYTREYCRELDGQVGIYGAVFMEYTNPSFTWFELIFKYVCLVTTLGLAGTFYYKIQVLDRWSYEQRWTLVLFGSLVFFNDPFCAIEIFAQTFFFQVFYTFASITFLVILLFFWLMTPSKIRYNAEKMKREKGGAVHSASKVVVTQVNGGDDLVNKSRRQAFTTELSCSSIGAVDTRSKDENCCVNTKTLREHGLKFSLCLLAWIGAFASEVYVRVIRYQDPAFDPKQDLGHFWLYIVLIVLVVISYCSWMLFLVGKGLLLRKYIKQSDRFIFVLNLCTLLFIGFGVSVGYMWVTPDTGLNLVLLIGLFNSYVWTLSFGFWPSQESIIMANRRKQVQLEDISDRNAVYGDLDGEGEERTPRENEESENAEEIDDSAITCFEDQVIMENEPPSALFVKRKHSFQV